MTNLTQAQHAHILAAYINRIPLAQLEEIVQAQRAAWNASLNLGATAQHHTQRHANEITDQAVRHITHYDRQLIEQVMARLLASRCSHAVATTRPSK